MIDTICFLIPAIGGPTAGMAMLWVLVQSHFDRVRQRQRSAAFWMSRYELPVPALPPAEDDDDVIDGELVEEDWTGREIAPIEEMA